MVVGPLFTRSTRTRTGRPIEDRTSSRVSLTESPFHDWDAGSSWAQPTNSASRQAARRMVFTDVLETLPASEALRRFPSSHSGPELHSPIELQVAEITRATDN